VVIGVRRWDLPRLPEHVVREAIANAVAHRAYDHDRTAVVVEIRPDRLVVTSPGRLLPGVTIEDLRHSQAARNPAVIAVLRRFALTEDAGLGVDRMQDGMSEEMLDPPVFEEVGEFVRVTLPMSGPVTPRERAWLKDLESDGTLDRADRLLLVQAARREPALALSTDGPGPSVRLATVPRRLTNTEARRITGLDRDAALASLRRLRDRGFLTQHGSRGGAYYLLDRGLIRGAAHGMTDEEIEGVVLDAAASGPLRNEDVRVLTGMDRAAVGRLLSRLVERGRLERRGQRRGTTYALPRPDEPGTPDVRGRTVRA
jgi:ATP-dependent DNA helicase RecG